MSNPGDADDTPLTSIQQMAEYLSVGCKPRSEFRIGTEHEKFGFRHADLTPPPYLPADGQPGSIRDVLAGLARFGGAPILDRDNPIGLKQGAASVSLEPAGQLELSGGPLETLHETKAELDEHFRQVRAACEGLDLGFAPLGFHPVATRAAMPWMPKGRYAIMQRYMPLVGSMGLDMMTRTCTVQVNLDFASEADMRRMLRVSLLLQPLATALFANSPFTEGKPNGFMSYRAHVWTDTDNQRAGIPPVMFEDGFGFERYAAWLIENVPMYFVYRDGGYIDVAGQSFTDFIAGHIPALAGITATMGDFADHLTTAFTDVRLKRFLEMRGADAGRADMMIAQSALWVGLLYDDAALSAAEALLRGAGWDDAVAARAAVPRMGLEAPWRGGKLRDIVPDVVAIAADGLRARGYRNDAGDDERALLAPLQAIAAGAPTQAEHWLAQYHGAWNRDIRRIFDEAAI
ncbi:MAG TPA: glutamate--cysteine ligase [Acetobacteraceae bacterium]|jgi:glutamate--cysteine ligase|nr:glutamate--cysteine ligase [Acetobacteraceae bacterium]